MVLTHEQFRVACALVDLAGMPKETGASPAQCVQVLVEMASEIEAADAVAEQEPSATSTAHVCQSRAAQLTLL